MASNTEKPHRLEADATVVRRTREVVAQSRDLLDCTAHLLKPPYERATQKSPRRRRSSNG